MASQSGVKVPAAVTEEWTKATASGANSTRALVLLITGETFQHHATIPTSGDFKSDISLLLPSLSGPKTCASFVYRSDDKVGTGYDWLLITYVPDEAPVRQKMLTASSQAGLRKALGEGRISKSLFFTSASDLTPSAFSSHLAHLAAPPPLTASETALLQVREAEAEAAREAELSGNFRGMGMATFGAPAKYGARTGGVGGDVKGGVRGGIGAMGMMAGGAGAGGAGKKGMKFGEGVEDALKGLLSGNGQETGKAVMLQIETSSETLTVHFAGTISPSSLASKLPPKEPCYTFYAWPQAVSAPTKLNIPSRQESIDPTNVELPATPIGGPSTATGEPKEESSPSETTETTPTQPAPAEPTGEKKSDARIGFIYTCPTGSTVKWRMMYSVNVGFVVREAEGSCGFKVEKKIETSDISDLTEKYLKTELFPAITQPAKSHSTSSYTGASSGGFRNFGAPARSTTLPSSGNTAGATSASSTAGASANASETSGDGRGAGGALPDSAFSVFGPRMNVGSPGAGGGFARPRPAGKR